MELLSTRNLCKTYGTGEAKVDAVKNVSFSVEKGEFVAIVGPSGSGKSTLLNLLGALDAPTSGKVLLDGKDVFTMKEKELSVFRRRNIGFIFQAYNLVPELNVEENIILPLLLDYRKPDRKYIDELLEILGLTQRKHHLPNQLSGGQQQRVAIGRALATKPAMILADEPTGNLDSKNSRDVINLLKLSVERYHQTLVMITHNPSFASFADRILNVEDGIVTELGGEHR
ncbi:ABC transporter ATP-binding protein [Paenibacillus sp. 22594]|uniref:ABC transporter ATP-binding protein n=1 Tax=Paenibacillus sp. 22594 TaxID=3453947 RepID=UPI003F84C275